VSGRIWPVATMHGLGACHARSAGRLAVPWPGGSVQPRMRPARSPASRWRPAGGKVLGSSTTTTRRMRRARRVEAGLTEEVEHGWGRAPGAVGVDEGGEVGSKIENGGGLGGSHHGGER
jgi:hypothetical protein